MRAGDPEVEQEWTVAQTLAGIKVALATANFLVIFLDHSVPIRGDFQSMGVALSIALIFWTYTVGAYVSVRKRRVKIRSYAWVTPILDIALGAALILATDGHASPFNSWLVLAVVATGFSPDKRIPLLATILAIGAHAAIAMVPQQIPLNPAVLMVRTTFMFGFAAMVAALGGTLSRQARAFGVVERTGSGLAATKTEHEANELFFSGLQRLLNSPEIEFQLHGGPLLRKAGKNRGDRLLKTVLRSGSTEVGELRINRSGSFDDSERRWVALLCERYTTCIKRLRLTEDLLQASTRAERMRMADEIHDGHLQNLTAAGFYLEAMRLDDEENEDLEEVCQLIRLATVQARELLAPVDMTSIGGEDHLHSIFRDRWQGEYSIELDPNVKLSEGRWGALEWMVKEGLNNARRHGTATVASLKVTKRIGQIVAALECNGVGPQGRVQYGYGLSRLSAIAKSNAGEMTLARSDSGGAVLSITFLAEDDK